MPGQTLLSLTALNLEKGADSCTGTCSENTLVTGKQQKGQRSKPQKQAMPAPRAVSRHHRPLAGLLSASWSPLPVSSPNPCVQEKTKTQGSWVGTYRGSSPLFPLSTRAHKTAADVNLRKLRLKASDKVLRISSWCLAVAEWKLTPSPAQPVLFPSLPLHGRPFPTGLDPCGVHRACHTLFGLYHGGNRGLKRKSHLPRAAVGKSRAGTAESSRPSTRA